MMNKDILRCFWLPSECYHTKEKKQNRKDNDRYLKRSPILPDGYFEIVNDALKEIYRGGGGIVFNEKQAVTVCSFLECPSVEFREWYIYITEKR